MPFVVKCGVCGNEYEVKRMPRRCRICGVNFKIAKAEVSRVQVWAPEPKQPAEPEPKKFEKTEFKLDVKPEQKPEAEPKEDDYECGNCGAKLQKGVKRCPNCGVKLIWGEGDG